MWVVLASVRGATKQAVIVALVALLVTAAPRSHRCTPSAPAARGMAAVECPGAEERLDHVTWSAGVNTDPAHGRSGDQAGPGASSSLPASPRIVSATTTSDPWHVARAPKSRWTGRRRPREDACPTSS